MQTQAGFSLRCLLILPVCATCSMAPGKKRKTTLLLSSSNRPPACLQRYISAQPVLLISLSPVHPEARTFPMLVSELSGDKDISAFWTVFGSQALIHSLFTITMKSCLGLLRFTSAFIFVTSHAGLHICILQVCFQSPYSQTDFSSFWW